MNKIDTINEGSALLNAHQTLLRKFGNSFLFSIIWRLWIFQYLPAVILTLLGCFGLYGLELNISEDVSLGLSVGIGVLAFIFIVLSTTPYLVNKFSRLQFKNFNVCLVKHNQIVDKMERYDSLCWMGSLLWRNTTLGLVYAGIAFVIEEYALISPEIMQHADRGIQISAFFLALYWLLRTKKTGRLILLQQKGNPATA